MLQFKKNAKYPAYVNNYVSKWPEVKKLNTRKAMMNPAVMQVMGAYLTGDKYLLINDEKIKYVRWDLVPSEVIVYTENKKTGEISSAFASYVMALGVNPKEITDTLRSIVKDDGQYVCTYCELESEPDLWGVMCPMHLVYNVIKAILFRDNHAGARMAKRSPKPKRWAKQKNLPRSRAQA